jgi:hypothetical protein
MHICKIVNSQSIYFSEATYHTKYLLCILYIVGTFGRQFTAFGVENVDQS